MTDHGLTWELPDGAQVNQEEWDKFIAFAKRAHMRRFVRVLSKFPSQPRCYACGGPFGGFGGKVMNVIGRGPSRMSPNWCSSCFEHSPEGGFVGEVGVLFADVRGSTAMAERVRPDRMVALLDEFYDRAAKVILRNGLVNKMIGDEIMGVYIPILIPGGKVIDALIHDAEQILREVGYGTAEGPLLHIGVGIDFGQSYLGHVGTEAASDFTVIGDVPNTAARLCSRAEGGQVVMRHDVAARSGSDRGWPDTIVAKGKAEPLDVRILDVA